MSTNSVITGLSTPQEAADIEAADTHIENTSMPYKFLFKFLANPNDNAISPERSTKKRKYFDVVEPVDDLNRTEGEINDDMRQRCGMGVKKVKIPKHPLMNQPAYFEGEEEKMFEKRDDDVYGETEGDYEGILNNDGHNHGEEGENVQNNRAVHEQQSATDSRRGFENIGGRRRSGFGAIHNSSVVNIDEDSSSSYNSQKDSFFSSSQEGCYYWSPFSDPSGILDESGWQNFYKDYIAKLSNNKHMLFCNIARNLIGFIYAYCSASLDIRNQVDSLTLDPIAFQFANYLRYGKSEPFKIIEYFQQELKKNASYRKEFRASFDQKWGYLSRKNGTTPADTSDNNKISQFSLSTKFYQDNNFALQLYKEVKRELIIFLDQSFKIIANVSKDFEYEVNSFDSNFGNASSALTFSSSTVKLEKSNSIGQESHPSLSLTKKLPFASSILSKFGGGCAMIFENENSSSSFSSTTQKQSISFGTNNFFNLNGKKNENELSSMKKTAAENDKKSSLESLKRFFNSCPTTTFYECSSPQNRMFESQLSNVEANNLIKILNDPMTSEIDKKKIMREKNFKCHVYKNFFPMTWQFLDTTNLNAMNDDNRGGDDDDDVVEGIPPHCISKFILRHNTTATTNNHQIPNSEQQRRSEAKWKNAILLSRYLTINFISKERLRQIHIEKYAKEEEYIVASEEGSQTSTNFKLLCSQINSANKKNNAQSSENQTTPSHNKKNSFFTFPSFVMKNNNNNSNPIKSLNNQNSNSSDPIIQIEMESFHLFNLEKFTSLSIEQYNNNIQKLIDLSPIKRFQEAPPNPRKLIEVLRSGSTNRVTNNVDFNLGNYFASLITDSEKSRTTVDFNAAILEHGSYWNEVMIQCSGLNFEDSIQMKIKSTLAFTNDKITSLYISHLEYLKGLLMTKKK